MSVFEELTHIKSMTAPATGTVEAPGKNVRRKAGLDRAILDKSWYQIENRTGEEQVRYRHMHLVVAALSTSITCHKCAHLDKESRVSESMFVCTNCGYEAHAGQNATDEILKRGIKLAFAAGTRFTGRQGYEPGAGFSRCGARSGRCWAWKREQRDGHQRR